MNRPSTGPTADVAPPAAGAADGSPPVGPFATLALGLAVLLGYLLLQGLVMAVLGIVGASPDQLAGGGVTARIEERAGLLFSLASLVAAPLTVAAVVGLTWLWASGPEVGDRAAWRAVGRHLGAAPPALGATLRWLAATALFLAVYEVASRLLDRPPLPDFMVELHATSGSLWWLAAAVVLAAPAVEEVMFRGFLLPGLAASRLRPGGAVVLTAVLWAAIHLQYDPFDMAAIVVLGLIFGVARLRTGSVWVPFLLHLAVNLVAMVQLVWSLGWR